MGRRADHVDRLQQVIVSTGAKFQARSEAVLSDAIQHVLAARNWPFMRREFQSRTLPTYNTGTVDVTKGEVEISGTGTAWHKGYQGGLISITPSSGNADWFRIRGVTAATTIQLDGAYAGATDTGLTYALYQDTYYLPFDCEGVFATGVWIENYEERLAYLDAAAMQYQLHGDTPSIDEPRYFCDGFASEETLYETGTVAITANTAAVTGTSTAWNDALLQEDTVGDVLEGVPIEFNLAEDANGDQNRARRNGIYNVTSITALTLAERFQHSANITGESYVIGPPGSRMIRFYPLPSTAKVFGGLYRRAFLGMYADNDRSDIPDQYDHVVNAFASWFALRHMPGSQIHLAKMADYKAQAQRDLLAMAAKEHRGREEATLGPRQDWPVGALTGRPAVLEFGDYGTFSVSE